MNTGVPIYDPTIKYAPDDYKVVMAERDLNAPTPGSASSTLGVSYQVFSFFVILSSLSFLKNLPL